MKRPVWIYALVDPRTLEPRYIGRSVHPEVRYAQHTAGCTTKGLGDWFGELRKERRAEARPFLMLLDRVKPEWADEAEDWWIQEGKRRGWKLLNVVRLRKFKGAA